MLETLVRKIGGDFRDDGGIRNLKSQVISYMRGEKINY